MIAQIVNGAMATKKALQKQPRINKSRAESMCLLQESALTLLLDHDPDALTIREIAELAGLPHRYIPHYFGGKAELFASIYPETANQAATKVTFPFAGALANQLAPEITRHARLAIWLSSKHPSGIPKTERPIQKQLTQTLKHQFNLDETTANLASERLIALVLVYAAFPNVINPDHIDLQAHLIFEMAMLAKHAQK
jgi:AcrR family transcriptional regulator